MTIGERIKAMRKQKKMTQKQVADKCGMADSAIRKYESGTVTPKIETLQRIAAALDVPISYFYGFNDNQAIDTILNEVFSNSPNAIVTRLDDSDNDDDADIHIDLTGGKALSNAHAEAHSLIDMLNEVGALRAAGYIDELLENPKYKKEPPQE